MGILKCLAYLCGCSGRFESNLVLSPKDWLFGSITLLIFFFFFSPRNQHREYRYEHIQWEKTPGPRHAVPEYPTPSQKNGGHGKVREK